jgi:hypothetical protein
MALLAGPVLAKGSGGKSGGFSSGGRSSFSSGSKASPPTTSKSPTAGRSSFSSPLPGSGASGSGLADTGSGSGSGTAGKNLSSGSGGPVTGADSYGKGYTTGTGGFSTPRATAPPSLTGDYSGQRQDVSSDRASFGGSRPSYSGTWDRSAAQKQDRYPSSPPVGVFGAPAEPPYYYHNQYWGLPWYARMFFQPNYYSTGWGYDYFEPRILTWLVVLLAVAGGGYCLYRYWPRRPPQ